MQTGFAMFGLLKAVAGVQDITVPVVAIDNVVFFSFADCWIIKNTKLIVLSNATV